MALMACALFALRVVYLTWFTPYGLAPDEAQYWTWLQNNDWSFLTKPPLTTWAMGLSTALLGDTLVGVKLFALLSQSIVPLLGAALARELAAKGREYAAGWWAFALLATTPMVMGGGLIMAPDALLVPLWLGALLGLVKAFGVPEARALCWPRWIIIGLLVGLAGLAKYSAAAFFPLLAVMLLWHKRSWFMKPQPYVAGLIALALQTPVIYWNSTNGWAGLHHVLWQAEGDSKHGGLATLAEFLGGQALVLGPLAFVLLVLVWVSGGRNLRRLQPRTATVLMFTLPMFLVFLAQTLGAKVQANWPILATLPALPLAAAWLSALPLGRWWRAALVTGLLFSATLGGLLYNTLVLRPLLTLKTDPTKDLLGWQGMGELFGTLLQRLDRPLVLGVRYQTIAPLAFHTPNIDWFYWNAEGRRATDYDDWLWPQSLPNRPVVLVKETEEFPIHLVELFENCIPWHSLGVEQRGEVTRRLYTWVCSGYRAQTASPSTLP